MATIHEMPPIRIDLRGSDLHKHIERARAPNLWPVNDRPREANDNEAIEALSWAMLAAAALGGFVAGMLVTAGLALLIGLFL